MRKPLTDTFIRAIQPPEKGIKDYTDPSYEGLAFRISAGGSRSFTFRFRDPKTGKESRITLGRYPAIGLAKARALVNQARVAISEGRNPAYEKKRRRATSASRLFSAVADQYVQTYARQKKRSSEQDEWILNKHVKPRLGDMLADEIREADIIELTRPLVEAGKLVMANRVFSCVRSVFNVMNIRPNPCWGLSRPGGKEESSDRVLSDDEIRAVWRLCVLEPVSERTGKALRLILLTGARPGEVAGMRRSELSKPDSDEALWTIPAARVKNKRTHLVPLSRQARDIIATLPGEVLFPNNRGEPIHPHALATAMARMIEHHKMQSMIHDPASPHDLRRTVGTRMSALGVPKEDRDAVLNHKAKGVSGVYDRYERLAEKRAALDKIGVHIASVLRNVEP